MARTRPETPIDIGREWSGAVDFGTTLIQTGPAWARSRPEPDRHRLSIVGRRSVEFGPNLTQMGPAWARKLARAGPAAAEIARASTTSGRNLTDDPESTNDPASTECGPKSTCGGQNRPGVAQIRACETCRRSS